MHRNSYSLRGKSVWAMIPSGADEAFSSGNCYSAGQNVCGTLRKAAESLLVLSKATVSFGILK
jgi:hypothetical protein